MGPRAPRSQRPAACQVPIHKQLSQPSCWGALGGRRGLQSVGQYRVWDTVSGVSAPPTSSLHNRRPPPPLPLKLSQVDSWVPLDPEAAEAPTDAMEGWSGVPSAAHGHQCRMVPRGAQSQSLSPVRGLSTGPRCLGPPMPGRLRQGFRWGQWICNPLSVLTLPEAGEGAAGQGGPQACRQQLPSAAGTGWEPEPGPEAVGCRR